MSQFRRPKKYHVNIRTSVVVVSHPVGPGTVTTPPQPPTQLVTTTVDVAILVTHFVVPFSVVVEVTYERWVRFCLVNVILCE